MELNKNYTILSLDNPQTGLTVDLERDGYVYRMTIYNCRKLPHRRVYTEEQFVTLHPALLKMCAILEMIANDATEEQIREVLI